MKMIAKGPMPIEGNPDWTMLGVAEDSNRVFMFFRHEAAPMFDEETGEPVISPNTGKQMTMRREYIEEVKQRVAWTDLNVIPPLDLHMIDQEKEEDLWQALFKFFNDEVTWADVIRSNKIILDAADKKGLV